MPVLSRHLAISLSLMLTACSSSDFSTAPPPYVPPSAPTENAIAAAIAQAAGEQKLTAPFLISAVHPTEHGPGLYYFCLKQTTAPADIRRTYYAVFTNGEEYKGARLSVMIDDCEHQTYSPAPAVAPITPPPPPAAQHEAHKKHQGVTE
jgi:hypothetical protein